MSVEPNPWVPGRVVRISRDIADTLDVSGFVVAVSEEWVVLEREYEFFLLGFAALRRQDIDLVVVDEFRARALQAVGEVPSDPGRLDLGTTEDLVASIAQQHPLVVVHTEYEEPDVCWVGQVRDCEEGRMRLCTISPQAEWDEREFAWDLDDVSMLEFGGRYEQALWTLGGPPPEGDD